MSQISPERYCVGDDTPVGAALSVVPGAEAIFERHGCTPAWECTDEHLAEYTLLDTGLTCHVDDTDALIADLNAAFEADEARWADGTLSPADVPEPSLAA